MNIKQEFPFWAPGSCKYTPGCLPLGPSSSVLSSSVLLVFPSRSPSAASEKASSGLPVAVFLNLDCDILSIYADVVSRHASWRGRTQLLARCDIKNRSMPRAGDLFAVEIAF